jgi:hypothetical protein
MRHLLALLFVCACATTSEPEPDPIDPDVPGSSGCPAADVITPKCGALSSTSYLSIASRSEQSFYDIVVVDAATGSTCDVMKFATGTDLRGVSSLAAIGTDIYFCAAGAGERKGTLTHISLLDGTGDQATTECFSVAAYGGKLVVLRELGETLELIENIGMWMSPTLVQVQAAGEILGFGDDKLYSTHPRPESVFVYEPITRETSAFDMQFSVDAIGVKGLAANGGALTILDGLPDTQYLLSVDAVSGVEIGRIPVGEQDVRLHGLTNTCSGSAVFL